MLDDITIIIPAHNRPNRLKRLLDYYSETNAHIIVPDSSDEIYTLGYDPQQVTYIHTPRLHFLKKIHRILPLISTPFVVYCADDDFAVPEGLQACADFLSANPDYSVAQGHYLTFIPKSGGKVEFSPRYIRNFDSRIDAETPQQRLENQTSKYASLLYGLARTKHFITAYNHCFVNKNAGNEDQPLFTNLFLAEEYFNDAMLILGKYATLRTFYSARELIPGSATATTIPASVIKRTKSHAHEFTGFITALANLLSETTGIPQQQAAVIIERVSKAPDDTAVISLKRRIVMFICTHKILLPLEKLSTWRYNWKGRKAVAGMDSYPCGAPTSQTRAIIKAISSTTN